jgi:hypothetical protein
MALSGQAKAEYQREYMRRKRNAATAKPSVTECSFCNEAGGVDRLLVSDHDGAVFICEACIAMAVDSIAGARGR